MNTGEMILLWCDNAHYYGYDNEHSLFTSEADFNNLITGWLHLNESWKFIPDTEVNAEITIG